MVIGFGLWFILLVPFVVLMVVVGNRRRNDGEDEEVGSRRYHGEEEEEEEEDDRNPKKAKEELTPLWKYVTKTQGGKGGGTCKFTCHHCNITYTGSYTRVRRHLCGSMPSDEKKSGGVCICKKVLPTQRAIYRKEENEAIYKSKGLKADNVNDLSSPSTRGSGFSPVGSRKTLSDFLDQGCRDDVDSKVYRFLFACGIPFNVLRSPYWHEMVAAIRGAPAGYMSPGYDKARTVGLDKEKAKIQAALGQFTNEWNDTGVSIVSDGWTNVKGKPLINILGVSASGAVFLSAHDYSEKFKTGLNIAELLLKTIESIGPYNVIQVITDNAANCKSAGAIIEDKYPNIFWSGCLVHTLNLLVHDIIKIKENDYRWIGALYKKGKHMIRFITNHSNAHGIFRTHSKLELLKVGKTRFASYYLTFRRLLKVREALASMVSSESWQVLKDRATSTFDRRQFQEVEDTVLDTAFWKNVKYVLQFIKPVYYMIRFADTDKPVIGEVYEQMDSMLGQIKDIVDPKDPILYKHIHAQVVKRWDHLNVPLHALAYVLTPKYYSPSWLAKPAPGGMERKKPHTDSEVQAGYMTAIDKLVSDPDECDYLRSELSKYLSELGPFGTLHAKRDRDRVSSMEWWTMYGSPCPRLYKMAMRVLSQVVNSSSAERCWSTYSFIHSVKRNRLNENRAESLVYVHYNLRLLSHYCERAKTDRSYVTWDNNPEEHNLEDGSLTLERLEQELLGEEDDLAAAAAMPPPTCSLFPSDAPALPSGSRPPFASVSGGRAGVGRGSAALASRATGGDDTTPIVHRPREKKLEISRGKRKH